MKRYRRYMEQAGPPVILINARQEMLHLSAAAGRFLAFDKGELTRDLSQAVHPALQDALRTALERASLSRNPEVVPGPTLTLHGELQIVCVRVSPLIDACPGHALVAFEAHPLHLLAQNDSAEEPRPRSARSETERLRSQLNALSTQHSAVVEKHQTDAEELRAMNEELRMTSEELEAGKEELQSLNEELSAANLTLKSKIDELGSANSDLRNLMRATAIATVFLDQELRIIRYTPAATALFRLMEDDIGRPLAHLRHDLDYPELDADAASVLAWLKPVEREIGADNGQWFLARLLPYRLEDDQVAGVVLTCTNITERKQFEAHRQAMEAAERVNKVRNEFLSRMSHELRTPLNAILGFGQILELGSRDEQDTMALGLILKAGRHLLALVDEVLDLSHAEAGELRLTFGAVDLGRLFRECVQLTAKLAAARQVVCEVEETGEALPILWTDEQRLRQVLLNLLTNAIKYNRTGGRVTLDCRVEGGDRYTISVRDTGLGIAAGDLPRLFTPFERLHQEHAEIEGTGLGLAITRGLTAALGGTIGVESEPGQGSRFWIELPSTPAPAAPPQEAAVLLSPPPGIGARRDITLLCIEDNASNLELVQMVAARQWPHWRFLSAHNARTGLEQARRHTPNLILLDLQLPDHPGDWVLAELQRNPRTAGLPVLVLSADATTHGREKLLAAGAVEYVTKPFEVGNLVRAVNGVIQLSAEGQGYSV